MYTSIHVHVYWIHVVYTGVLRQTAYYKCYCVWFEILRKVIAWNCVLFYRTRISSATLLIYVQVTAGGIIEWMKEGKFQSIECKFHVETFNMKCATKIQWFILLLWNVLEPKFFLQYKDNALSSWL